jgi:hypothetical protein
LKESWNLASIVRQDGTYDVPIIDSAEFEAADDVVNFMLQRDSVPLPIALRG